MAKSSVIKDYRDISASTTFTVSGKLQRPIVNQDGRKKRFQIKKRSPAAFSASQKREVLYAWHCTALMYGMNTNGAKAAKHPNRFRSAARRHALALERLRPTPPRYKLCYASPVPSPRQESLLLAFPSHVEPTPPRWLWLSSAKRGATRESIKRKPRLGQADEQQ